MIKAISTLFVMAMICVCLLLWAFIIAILFFDFPTTQTVVPDIQQQEPVEVDIVPNNMMESMALMHTLRSAHVH